MSFATKLNTVSILLLGITSVHTSITQKDQIREQRAFNAELVRSQKLNDERLDKIEKSLSFGNLSHSIVLKEGECGNCWSVGEKFAKNGGDK